MFNMLLMGPPGAGKGTQARCVAQHLGVRHLASGDVVRAEVGGGTQMGQEAKAYMEAGKLVPDDLMTRMVAGHIKGACERDGGVVLDGYPRTLPQAECLSTMMGREDLHLDSVVNLRVPAEELLDRLLNRLTCKACNRVYHKTNNPPAKQWVCDDDGTALISRADDTREVIEERLRVYAAQTQPVLAYYEDQGLLKEVDGTGPIDVVFQSVVEYLKCLRGE